MQRTQKLQGMQNLAALLTAPHLPKEAFNHLSPRVVITEGYAHSTEEGCDETGLCFRYSTRVTTIHRIVAGCACREEGFETVLCCFLTFARSADLLHQAE